MTTPGLNSAPINPAVNQAVHKLGEWLESMCGAEGYTGPVAHWWDSCLVYCGPAADWRYEGIILGYLNLYQLSKADFWLERACRAADYLLAGQLPDGRFRNSSFEIGAQPGGTPHEAAVDHALFKLAQVLRQNYRSEWEKYAVAAEKNVELYLIGQLWNGNGFQEQPFDTTLVPNKNGTTLEALLAYQFLTGKSQAHYIYAAARVITSNQVQEGPRLGATIHTGTGSHQLAISLYTARCANALLSLYEYDQNPQWLEAVSGMLKFMKRMLRDKGIAFGQYRDGSTIESPCWISPSADWLQVIIRACQYPQLALEPSLTDQLVNQLLKAQTSAGGIANGLGLAQKGRRIAPSPNALPEFRDILPAVGWCDKAFRALSLLYQPENGPERANEQEHSSLEKAKTLLQSYQTGCHWKGQRCLYYEDATEIRLTRLDSHRKTQKVLYQWKKGTFYPCIFNL